MQYTTLQQGTICLPESTRYNTLLLENNKFYNLLLAYYLQIMCKLQINLSLRLHFLTLKVSYLFNDSTNLLSCDTPKT